MIAYCHLSEILGFILPSISQFLEKWPLFLQAFCHANMLRLIILQNFTVFKVENYSDSACNIIVIVYLEMLGSLIVRVKNVELHGVALLPSQGIS